MTSTTALVSGHFFVSDGGSRHAACECGVLFEWSGDRFAEHARHLLDVTYQAGFEAGRTAQLAGQRTLDAFDRVVSAAVTQLATDLALADHLADRPVVSTVQRLHVIGLPLVADTYRDMRDSLYHGQ